MSNAHHTPLPWVVTGRSLALVHSEAVDQYGYRTLVARCETIPAGVPDAVQAENAKLIVRACNVHPHWLRALSDLATNWDHDEDAHREGRARSSCRVCIAEIALARLKS